MNKKKDISAIIYNKSFKVMNGHQLENNSNKKKPGTLHILTV